MKQILRIASSIGFLSASSLAQVVGVNWEGQAVMVEQPSGASAVLNPSAFVNANAMAKDATGRLVVSAVVPATLIPRLYTFDLETLAPILLTYPFLNDIRALSFPPRDTTHLYALDVVGSVQDNLYVLDLTVLPGDSSIHTLIGQSTI